MRCFKFEGGIHQTNCNLHSLMEEWRIVTLCIRARRAKSTETTMQTFNVYSGSQVRETSLVSFLI